MPTRHITVFKILIGLSWMSVCIAVYFEMQNLGISFRHLPRFLFVLIRSFGAWGPLFIIGAHVFRTFFFIPSGALALITGSLYGPVWGTMLTLVGENLSASIAFGLGHFFGRRFVKEHEHGWIRKHDELLSKEGFFTILAMRLLFFPFDVVNYLSGMTGITFRQYIFATFLGLLPSAVTFSVLGNAFDHPGGFLLFGVLCGGTICIVLALRRLPWVKEKLFAKAPEHVI